MKIDDIIQATRKEVNSQAMKTKKRRISIDINKENFIKLIILNATLFIKILNPTKEYIIDDNNKSIIEQLYYYITMNNKFTGDLYKGILLVGKYGSGKTIMMKAFCKTINDIIETSKINVFHSIELIDYIMNLNDNEEYKYNNIKYGNLFIDDIGKEASEIKDFGTIRKPIQELLTFKYNKGLITFATANIRLEVFKEKYGGAIADRMKEMFNFIELKGESKRK